MEHFIIIYIFKPRSISGKKLCSSCGLPLGKGAAMIIETLNLYFHIQCFKVCIDHASKYNFVTSFGIVLCWEIPPEHPMTFVQEATPSVLYRSVCGIHPAGWNSLLSYIPLGYWVRRSKIGLFYESVSTAFVAKDCLPGSWEWHPGRTVIILNLLGHVGLFGM